MEWQWRTKHYSSSLDRKIIFKCQINKRYIHILRAQCAFRRASCTICKKVVTKSRNQFSTIIISVSQLRVSLKCIWPLPRSSAVVTQRQIVPPDYAVKLFCELYFSSISPTQTPIKMKLWKLGMKCKLPHHFSHISSQLVLLTHFLILNKSSRRASWLLQLSDSLAKRSSWLMRQRILMNEKRNI